MSREEILIWPPYHIFYIQSMLFNTSSAMQSCEEASKYINAICAGSLSPQEKKDELLDCLQNVVNQGAAISRYFFPPRDEPRARTPAQKDLHKRRGQELQMAFDVRPDSPLENRALRNSIEHFDEKLDLYLGKGIVGHIFPSLILNEPEETDVPHHIFRAFYLREGIFQVLGERFEVQPIVDEISRIHHLLILFDKNGGTFGSA